MKCPKCSQQFKKIANQSCVLDYCEGCHGIWFDEGELFFSLKSLLGGDAGFVNENQLLDFKKNIISNNQLKCPTCDSNLDQFTYCKDESIILEQCSSCRGIWTDKGEFLALLQYLRNDPTKKEIVESIVDHNAFLKDVKKVEEDIELGPFSFLLLPFLLPYTLIIGDETPNKRVPYVTLFISFLCILVYCFNLIFGNRESFFAFFGFIPSEFLGVGLFASMFVHLNFWHIFVNIFVFWIFGDNVEDELGHLGMLFFFFAGGVISNVVHMFMNIGSTIPVVGASGSIAAMLGFYVVFFPFSRVKTLVGGKIYFIPTLIWGVSWFLSQFIIPHFASNIAIFAHIGGFLFGLLIGLVFRLFREEKSPAY